jgi:hypothetical protein
MKWLDSNSVCVCQQLFTIILHQHTTTIIITYLILKCVGMLNSSSMKQMNKFNIYGSVHHKNILIYIQQATTLHSLFYLETALHVSGCNSTHHQEHIQLYLQHLVFVTPLLLSAAIIPTLPR